MALSPSYWLTPVTHLFLYISLFLSPINRTAAATKIFKVEIIWFLKRMTEPIFDKTEGQDNIYTKICMFHLPFDFIFAVVNNFPFLFVCWKSYTDVNFAWWMQITRAIICSTYWQGAIANGSIARYSETCLVMILWICVRIRVGVTTRWSCCV